MKITCPTCNLVYNLPSHKIPKGENASAKCKKCGGRIVVEAKVEETKPIILEADHASKNEVKAAAKEVAAIRNRTPNGVLEKMYLGHFSLTDKPFQISPDPRFLWKGEKHQEALATLRYGILDNRGFLLLTGDVGTGKTTLINALLDTLKDDVIVAVIADPGLGTLDFFNFIAERFGLKGPFETKGRFLQAFEPFLIRTHGNGKKVLLILDEAQQLTPQLLEEIRLLSNIERRDIKLINIFFVGQNEFNDILLSKDNRSVYQRITVNYHLEPLTQKETHDYIRHRLEVAGANRPIFDNRAAKAIYAFSKGYPRLINVVCDRALLTGFVNGSSTINKAIVDESANDLRISSRYPRTDAAPTRSVRPWQKFVGIGFMAFAIFVFLYGTGIILLSQQSKFSPVSQTNLAPPSTEKTIDLSLTTSSTPTEKKPGKPQPAASARVEKKAKIPTEIKAGNPEAPASSTEEDPPEEPAEKSSVDPDGFINKKHSVFFGKNSNELPDSAHEILRMIALIMRQHPDLKIILRGYTDSGGNYNYNKRLSEFRAEAVRSYLLGKGIDSARIQAMGVGPVSPKPGSGNKTKNPTASRMVEIEIHQ